MIQGLGIALALQGSGGPPPPPPPPVPPNLLLVTLDDISNQYVDVYGEGPPEDQPLTPAMDALAARGMRFVNAYANPLCSPTRATLLTGCYSFRTGIGDAIGFRQDLHLDFDRATLPEALPPEYASVLLGKWHLGQRYGGFDPILHGFHHWDGTIANFAGGDDHYEWARVGALPWREWRRTETEYTSDWLSQEFGALLEDLAEPWFLSVNFNAAHEPWMFPPGYGSGSSLREKYMAMIEYADARLGEMLSLVDETTTYVVVLADNGTPSEFSHPPGRGKRTLYEAGVNVPFLVAGPSVVQGAVTEALVNTTDVFATFAELSGSSATAEDSVSFAPVLADPSLSPRDCVYFELFFEEIGFDFVYRGARDSRFKLIWDVIGDHEDLYDLSLAPPGEDGDPIPVEEWGPDEQAAYDKLRPVLDLADS